MTFFSGFLLGLEWIGFKIMYWICLYSQADELSILLCNTNLTQCLTWKVAVWIFLSGFNQYKCSVIPIYSAIFTLAMISLLGHFHCMCVQVLGKGIDLQWLFLCWPWTLHLTYLVLSTHISIVNTWTFFLSQWHFCAVCIYWNIV